ncbi:eukaryotic translation initiation factor 2D-like [Mya arenaria]|uniref:eukaryotic translation initiation factor 2D-like n=1 Tax=Mya arenaria TaxID=6604 RepID=UPI0022E112FC|nr:eukaryotic translation initiation factor 2D-like [Mya arenaria]
MFKKPFRVKSQTSMKGSDRKKLRVDIQKVFTGLSPEEVSEIIPNKEDVTVTKIYTNSGDNAFIYSVNKQPYFFEIDKQKVLFPTVYLLWRFPDLAERFTTWPPVFKRMVDGADLMLPGIVLRQQVTPSTFRHVQKGQVCSVNIVGNRCPVVVGQTLMSGSDFFDSGMKGKGIHPVHMLGDELWSFGDKSSPPSIEDDPLPSEYMEEDGQQSGDLRENGAIPTSTDWFEATSDGNKQEMDENSAINKDNASGDMESGDGVGDNTKHKDDNVKATSENDNYMKDLTGPGTVTQDGADNGEGASAPGDGAEDGGVELENLQIQEESTQLTPGEMDDLLQFCFLCALKASLKKSDLPIPTGTFYKAHMLKYSPKATQMDVKKSSFKKLSKFLQTQAKCGIIKVKELTKGVENIMEVDRSHEMFRGLEVPEIVEEPTESTQDGFTPPTITEMFAVTSNVLPLFKPMGYSKSSPLTSSDARKVITEYVKQLDNQGGNDKSAVLLDPILASICLTSAEGDKSTLQWEELFTRILNKMSPVFQLSFPDRPPILKKGSIDPIKIDVVQRASSKRVTIIENLDVYGIDAGEFGHRVQVKVACSASVTPSQQKGKGPQVIVQGNQINCVADLLTNLYKLPKKYIRGAEKAPKQRRK